MKITKEIGIDMGHTVTNHDSKCKHLHGHRYRIIATVDGELNSVANSAGEGMVIDFGVLKKAMMDVLDTQYDHAFIVWVEDPRKEMLLQAHEMHHNDIGKFHVVNYVPTAENLAKAWFSELGDVLAEKYNICLMSLEVFETPTSSAIYTHRQ